MAKPPKNKGKQKGKARAKKASAKVIDEDDDGGYESGSDISLGSLHSANSESSLASWNSRDQRSAFADFEALDSLNAMRDEEGYPIYNVEGILRWRRHPRRGFTQYRTMWANYPVYCTTWEPEAVFQGATTVQEFWDSQGGRPEDIPLPEDDASPSVHPSDTEGLKLNRDDRGRAARRKIRREIRRDKKEQKAYWKSKGELEKKELETRQALQGVEVHMLKLLPKDKEEDPGPSKRRLAIEDDEDGNDYDSLFDGSQPTALRGPVRPTSRSRSSSSSLSDATSESVNARRPTSAATAQAKAAKSSSTTVVDNGNKASGSSSKSKARAQGRSAPISQASLRAIKSDGKQKKTQAAKQTSTQPSKPVASGSRLAVEDDAPAPPTRAAAGPSSSAASKPATKAAAGPLSASGPKVAPKAKAPNMLDQFMSTAPRPSQAASSSPAASSSALPASQVPAAAPGSFIGAHKTRPKVRPLDNSTVLRGPIRNEGSTASTPISASERSKPPSPRREQAPTRRVSPQHSSMYGSKDALPSIPRKVLVSEVDTSVDFAIPSGGNASPSGSTHRQAEPLAAGARQVEPLVAGSRQAVASTMPSVTAPEAVVNTPTTGVSLADAPWMRKKAATMPAWLVQHQLAQSNGSTSASSSASPSTAAEERTQAAVNPESSRRTADVLPTSQPQASATVATAPPPVAPLGVPPRDARQSTASSSIPQQRAIPPLTEPPSGPRPRNDRQRGKWSVCKFFLEGNCRHTAADCHYSHEVELPSRSRLGAEDRPSSASNRTPLHREADDDIWAPPQSQRQVDRPHRNFPEGGRSPYEGASGSGPRSPHGATGVRSPYQPPPDPPAHQWPSRGNGVPASSSAPPPPATSTLRIVPLPTPAAPTPGRLSYGGQRISDVAHLSDTSTGGSSDVDMDISNGSSTADTNGRGGPNSTAATTTRPADVAEIQSRLRSQAPSASPEEGEVFPDSTRSSIAGGSKRLAEGPASLGRSSGGGRGGWSGYSPERDPRKRQAMA